MSADTDRKTDAVRRCYRAYETGDRDALEALLAPDFTFTSPYDDAIDRAVYFEHCWPGHREIERFEIGPILAEGDIVIAAYRLHFAGEAGPFRNVEIFRFAGDRIKAVEVYFGDPMKGEHGSDDAINGARRRE